MRHQGLQYYIHDDPDAFRLELSGSLSGEGAQSAYQTWRTALSIIGRRRLVVDLTFVGHADARGRALLRLWRRHGARIIAASAESRALAEPILGEVFPKLPARRGLLQRLGAFIGGRAGAAANPAFAEGGLTASASERDNSAGFSAASRPRRLEHRVP